MTSLCLKAKISDPHALERSIMLFHVGHSFTVFLFAERNNFNSVLLSSICCVYYQKIVLIIWKLSNKFCKKHYLITIIATPTITQEDTCRYTHLVVRAHAYAHAHTHTQAIYIYALHKLYSYGITGKGFSIIKSFPIGRSPKVVINGQSSGALAVNAGVPRRHSSDQPSFQFA